MHIFLYFLYAWISFNGFTIDSLENYQVFKRKPFPLFVKTHKFAQNNYFLMISDVLDRKLNMENQICNGSSFFNEKGILSLKNLVIFQTVDSKAIKTYPNVKKI
jgi:hypothetical protein